MEMRHNDGGLFLTNPPPVECFRFEQPRGETSICIHLHCTALRIFPLVHRCPSLAAAATPGARPSPGGGGGGGGRPRSGGCVDPPDAHQSICFLGLGSIGPTRSGIPRFGLAVGLQIQASNLYPLSYHPTLMNLFVLEQNFNESFPPFSNIPEAFARFAPTFMRNNGSTRFLRYFPDIFFATK